MNAIFLRRVRRPLALLVPLLLPAVCFAHGEQDGQGFVAGLLHPVFGFDHLLAMVSVGIVSAQLGGANIWRIPAAFVSMMVLGGLLGVLQVPLPLRELAIAASVVFLGIAIIHTERTTTPWVPFLFVAFFGMYHGHAHGTEMPGSASPAYYTFGFLISTTLLHLLGVLIGEIAIRRQSLVSGLRYTGAALAGVGTTFVLSGLGVALV